MADDVQPHADMGRLVLIYIATLIFSAAVLWGLAWAFETYAGVQYPFVLLLFMMPMVAGMQAGTEFFKQTARAASWRTALNFGLLTTLILLLGVIALWQGGGLDALFQMVDPVAFEQGDVWPVLSSLLIFAAAFGMFCNSLMFWSAARGGVKRQERKNASEQKAAAKANAKAR
ncbi:ABZJ_00895 family protein [Paracoccus tegillarcae]|uniref:Uncharacterized protein n=1 Tax=Paracoccus tegillarcae TaxID=1529068 RepID=A0A2K9EWT0_9RHOB|nr:ABZJ_00895 family protein [Paracoccus tegillarcae]AUH32512.1 hypothetical protein CUV01_03120 [Paracoccus tegillarcae]